MTSWKRLWARLEAPKFKRWYKKYVHRKNRRKAKNDPTYRDKPLNPREVD